MTAAKSEVVHGQPHAEAHAQGTFGSWAAGWPLMVVLAAVQVAWLLALGYVLARLVF